MSDREGAMRSGASEESESLRTIVYEMWRRLERPQTAAAILRVAAEAVKKTRPLGREQTLFGEHEWTSGRPAVMLNLIRKYENTLRGAKRETGSGEGEPDGRTKRELSERIKRARQKTRKDQLKVRRKNNDQSKLLIKY
jgi:hypothetical protein